MFGISKSSAKKWAGPILITAFGVALAPYATKFVSWVAGKLGVSA